MVGHSGAIRPRLQTYQDGIDNVGIRRQGRGKISRGHRGEVFLGIQRPGQPLSLGAHLFIIFLKGHFLGVRQRKKNQGVAVGVDGSLGQAHHRIGMEAQRHLVSQSHPQFFVSHHFVMGPVNTPAGNDFFRAAQPVEDVVADDAEMPALTADLALHRIVNKGSRPSPPRELPGHCNNNARAGWIVR